MYGKKYFYQDGFFCGKKHGKNRFVPPFGNNLPTLFLGHSVLLLLHSRAEEKIIIWTFKTQVSKTENKIYLTSLFDAHGLILMLSELFHIIISCKIVDSSMKLKKFHKISIIQKKFLLLLNLLWVPDITCSGAGSGPRVVHPCYSRIT